MKYLAMILLTLLCACGGGGSEESYEGDTPPEEIAQGKSTTGKPDCTKLGNCN